MIEVKVVRVPAVMKDVALEDGATVADALRAADLSVQTGEKIQVNGVDATPSKVLSNGDRVILAKGAKGNA